MKTTPKGIHASNLSTGATLLTPILRKASQEDWKAAIVEIHREGKLDSPSGTALDLQKALSALPVRDQDVTSLRIGEVAGDHQIFLQGRSASMR